MKTKIPKDFQVTDKHREYCAKNWGLLYLPDVYLPEFMETFEQNERTHKDWDRTFILYIRNSSPKGQRFYKPWKWEERCQQARTYRSNGGPHRRTNTGDTRTVCDDGGRHRPSTWIPASPEGLEALKRIADLMPNWRRT